jgi:GDP-D-mannose 3',5'-epimerase
MKLAPTPVTTQPPARILVTGAGGFIGAHFVTYLKNRGHWVRGVDVHPPEFSKTDADEFVLADLRLKENCEAAAKDVDWVIHLAAMMGGIGYIESHKAEIVRDNVLMNIHMLEAAKLHGAKKFFFPSSACIYPIYKQQTAGDTSLRESDAYPADPEDGYGWEKLFMERMCRHYREDFGLNTYVARFHNVYGTLGVYDGGKEKSPAAICRKVALAKDGDSIEVWGDGLQTRSYCYVTDCIEGVYRLIHSNHHDPINIGSDYLVSINELIDMVAKIAHKKINKAYDTSKPQGVRGRNSNNEQLRKVLQWEPQISLQQGMADTYHWIEAELAAKHVHQK